jgi:thioesterase domain-containing protein
LLAARIVALVEQQFSRKLSVAAVFRLPTVEQLAGLLRNGDSQSAEHAGFSIVEIQPQGSAPPLFLVHGIGGGMFWGYANLARYLGNGQPIFAFKSRGLEGLEEFNTIEEMATHYVADLRAFRPRGPYRLGGYCFGGNVAYEMARQLEAQGETIAMLALFNCPAQNSAYDRIRITPAFCFRFIKNLGYWTAHVLELPPDQRRRFLQWKAGALAKKGLRFLHLRRSGLEVEEWMDLSGQPEERHQLWSAHLRAYLAHRPKPYAGRVTLLRTPGHPFLCSFDDACGWRELATGGVDVHLVPGAHESILDEPHVRTTAEALKRCFRNLPAA